MSVPGCIARVTCSAASRSRSGLSRALRLCCFRMHHCFDFAIRRRRAWTKVKQLRLVDSIYPLMLSSGRQIHPWQCCEFRSAAHSIEPDIRCDNYVRRELRDQFRVEARHAARRVNRVYCAGPVEHLPCSAIATDRKIVVYDLAHVHDQHARMRLVRPARLSAQIESIPMRHAAITLSAAFSRLKCWPSCFMSNCALSSEAPGLITRIGMPTFLSCSRTASGPTLPSVRNSVGSSEIIPSALSARW